MDILVEQLVYGSFPFWDRGYDVLAKSPGCRPVWVADVLAACRKLGEAPSGLTPASSLFALKLSSGPWAVVGVDPQGVDDRGRPGALAFHALVIDPGDYRKAGSNPFVFAGSLRHDWTAGTTLQAVFCSVEKIPPAPPVAPRGRNVVEALARRRRVAIESAEPIEALAREVWPCLPESARRRASVATWAFGNANRFDLAAFPRLAGVEFDSTYLEPEAIDLEPTVKAGSLPRLPRSARWTIPLAGMILLGLAWLAIRRPDPDGNPPAPAVGPGSIPAKPAISLDDRARILTDLETLSERFELGLARDPGDLMARLASKCHYEGPILSKAELARLATDPDPDRDRALQWHELITRTFVNDRPILDEFRTVPLDQQLDRLAWSFHLEPRPPAVQIPEVLLKTLARTGPIRPTPLAGKYPALSDYARFLARLPRVE